MAKRVKNRPKPKGGLQTNFFDIDPITLDKKSLATVEEILIYVRQNNLICDNSDCIDIEKLINDNEELSLSFENINEDGQIYYNKETDKYDIKININHPKTRQRFTMAHEYIHYQINRDIIKENSHNDIILFRDDIIKLDIDAAANRYAAELLMPEKDFQQALAKYDRDIIKIAEIFGVSTIAVRYRAKDLGLEGHGL